MDVLDREIIKALQGDIPLSSRPWQEIAENIGIKEEELLSRIRKFKENGIIRRLGAVVRHNKAGFTVNAMLALQVEESKADEAGLKLAGFEEISHCYLRKVPEDFPYNLFAMVHASSEEELAGIIKRIVEATGINEYRVLRSLREMKKVSMTYF
ncbi:transcriptional regulator, AsnC family [Thermosyntropha lipolytica DSM 11003]|uniref:siroheme decarboxylase n=1 Tax=Thermosyntropha lipolytica DSM 11003 TaxID=1123382 RepID=A0A1M5NIN8_9FIRM|nr:AsnC family transcriptional regulator [Thermosyntropha lipolytica]SHG89454.1 transcriptional regulator, AsnC family [Thermosyntropha lipolytica DSM 11003]